MTSSREITGKHVLAITVSAFAIIIAVNFTLAYKAVGTFPGLETKNSYVSSQSFEARRQAQEALGWQAEAVVRDGTLELTLKDETGQPVRPDSLTALVGRPTVARDDMALELAYRQGVFSAPVTLEPGAWILKLDASSPKGVAYSKRMELWVR